MPKRNGATRRERKRYRKHRDCLKKAQQAKSESINRIARAIAKEMSANPRNDPDDNKKFYCPVCKMGYCKVIGIYKNMYCHECFHQVGCSKEVEYAQICIYCQ